MSCPFLGRACQCVTQCALRVRGGRGGGNWDSSQVPVDSQIIKKSVIIIAWCRVAWYRVQTYIIISHSSKFPAKSVECRVRFLILLRILEPSFCGFILLASLGGGGGFPTNVYTKLVVGNGVWGGKRDVAYVHGGEEYVCVWPWVKNLDISQTSNFHAKV